MGLVKGKGSLGEEMGGVSGKSGRLEKSQASAWEGEVPPEEEESHRQDS